MSSSSLDLQWANLKRAKQGDLAALADLLMKQWSALRWEAWQRGCRSAASNMASEAVREGLQKFRNFRGHSPCEFRAWLRYRLLACISAYQKYKNAIMRRPEGEMIPLDNFGADGSGPAPQLAARDATPRQAAITNEERTLVRRALLRLPSGHQEIIKLLYFECLEIQEIACRLGETRQTIALMLAEFISPHRLTR
jgi:RNA polymerase sigma factor (sigma-70 family)